MPSAAFHYLHGSPPCQDFWQHAFAIGRQMQNHDEGHAAVGGHVIEEFMKSIEATGRGADADNRKCRGAH